MEKIYNTALQDRVRACIESGVSQAELARRLGMNMVCGLVCPRALQRAGGGSVPAAALRSREQVVQGDLRGI